jgi:hypothetical protein
MQNYSINLKPGKALKNAPSPTCRLHAVLGGFIFITPKYSAFIEIIAELNRTTY